MQAKCNDKSFQDYILKDSDFLEKHTRLGFQINRNEFYNYTGSTKEMRFNENVYLIAKLFEYLSETRASN